MAFRSPFGNLRRRHFLGYLRLNLSAAERYCADFVSVSEFLAIKSGFCSEISVNSAA